MVIMVFQKFLYYEAPLSGGILTQLFGGDVVAVIVWELDLQLYMQSWPITTNIVSSNPIHGEVYSINIMW
jgi:hypothetical protein